MSLTSITYKHNFKRGTYLAYKYSLVWKFIRFIDIIDMGGWYECWIGRDVGKEVIICFKLLAWYSPKRNKVSHAKPKLGTALGKIQTEFLT
jgi:hypothetical protein